MVEHTRAVPRTDASAANGQTVSTASPRTGSPKGGKLLIIGWGSTYGAIRQAVHIAREQGKDVSHAHLKHLNPLPRNVGDILKRYDKVLIPEMNMGQLLKIIRAEFLVDAQGYSKVQGQPFQADELEAEIMGRLES